MRDLIMNLQTNCPPNHFIQLETVKDDMKFKIRKNDLVRFKGKLIYLHHKGVVTCIVNQNTLSLCAIVRSCLKMSKPARLYPKPEPVTINSRLMLIGCGVCSVIFFTIGWTFQTMGVVA